MRLAYQSWQFNDISTAADATPLWIPQIAMAAGTLILLVAFADEFALEVAGRPPRAQGRGRTMSNPVAGVSPALAQRNPGGWARRAGSRSTPGYNGATAGSSAGR